MAEPFWYEKANKARLSARRDMVDALDEYASWLGGTHLDKPGGPHHEARGEHREISRTLTQALNRSGLPPGVASGVAELGGYGNEGVTGALQAILGVADMAKGRPVTHSFFSPAGWDWADVEENREGQQEALAGPDERAPWVKALSAGGSPLAAVSRAGAVYGADAARKGSASAIGRLLSKLAR